MSEKWSNSDLGARLGKVRSADPPIADMLDGGGISV